MLIMRRTTLLRIREQVTFSFLLSRTDIVEHTNSLHFENFPETCNCKQTCFRAMLSFFLLFRESRQVQLEVLHSYGVFDNVAFRLSKEIAFLSIAIL